MWARIIPTLVCVIVQVRDPLSTILWTTHKRRCSLPIFNSYELVHANISSSLNWPQAFTNTLVTHHTNLHSIPTSKLPCKATQIWQLLLVLYSTYVGIIGSSTSTSLEGWWPHFILLHSQNPAWTRHLNFTMFSFPSIFGLDWSPYFRCSYEFMSAHITLHLATRELSSP